MQTDACKMTGAETTTRPGEQISETGPMVPNDPESPLFPESAFLRNVLH